MAEEILNTTFSLPFADKIITWLKFSEAEPVLLLLAFVQNES